MNVNSSRFSKAQTKLDSKGNTMFAKTNSFPVVEDGRTDTGSELSVLAKGRIMDSHNNMSFKNANIDEPIMVKFERVGL